MTYSSNYGQKDNYSFASVSFDENRSGGAGSNIDINPDNLKSFDLNYSTLVSYYKNMDLNYIEKGEVSFSDLEQNPLNINISSVQFNAELKDSTITLDLSVCPESVQKLFVLDEQQYIDKFNGEDFISAKKNCYDQLTFDEDQQSYSKKYFQFWDWKSLNHPPLRSLEHELEFYDKGRKPIDYDKIDSPFFSAEFHKRLDKLSNTHLTFGNRLLLLENGNSYKKKMELIRNSRSSILISVMSYFKDPSSRLMTDELIKKVESGVQVFIIVEKVWTKLLMKKELIRMKNNGIVVIYADDLLNTQEEGNGLFHNKFWVFDNKVAIIGGHNIIESENISTGFNHQSRDTDLMVEGPVVTDIALNFIDLLARYDFDERYNRKKEVFIEFLQNHLNKCLKDEYTKKLRGLENYDEKLSDRYSRMNGVCRLIVQGPHTDKYLVSKVYLEYFKNAQNSIDLTTGKITIDVKETGSHLDNDMWYQKIWNQIFTMADDGVKVNLISNGVDGGYGELSNYMKRKVLRKPNNLFINRLYPDIARTLDIKAAKRNYPYLTYLQDKENIDVWMYFQYMHSKTFMIDRFVVSVGSFNLDNWSSDKSHESVLICQDKDLAKEYEYQFILDKVNSVPVPTNNY